MHRTTVGRRRNRRRIGSSRPQPRRLFIARRRDVEIHHISGLRDVGRGEAESVLCAAHAAVTTIIVMMVGVCVNPSRGSRHGGVA